MAQNIQSAFPDPDLPKSREVVLRSLSFLMIAIPILQFAALRLNQRKDPKALLAAGGRRAVSYKILEPPIGEQVSRLAKISQASEARTLLPSGVP